MKVFFTASLRGKSFFGAYYKHIYQELEKLGFTHLDKEILVFNEKTFYDDLDKKGPHEYKNLYQRKINAIQQADICVFECSISSLSIGYQVEKSLQFNKPTIVLFTEGHTPQFLAGINEDKLIVKEYTKETLESAIQETLSDAQNLREKRFNFFISPYLLSYLEQASHMLGITKSTFIRNLILDHKKKNKISDHK